MAEADETTLERRVVGKVSRRLLPYLFLLYIIAYLDRVNVGVAHLQITRDRSIAPGDWGLGVGLFFSGYFLFEVPSNLILARVGARLWIARIMVVWGLVSCSMVFIRGPWSFFALRFLLGVAEAGFFPGILFYLTRWFRKEDRARAIALFMTAGTVTGVIGNPLSGSLLGLDGMMGLKGWQWLFLLEGLPAIVLGISVLFLLTERPETASWLSTPEREWLVGELRRADEKVPPGSAPGLLATLREPRVLLLSGIYFLVASGGHAFEFWLPDIVKSIIGQDAFRVTLVSAIPYLVATIVMILVARHSDRTGERIRHVAVAAFVAAAGFGAGGFLGNSILVLGALSIAWSGVKALQAPFWAIPPGFLTGTRSAAGMALINSVGNLGGQVGPWAMGQFLASSEGYAGGLRFSSALLLAAAVATTAFSRIRSRAPRLEVGGEGSPDHPPAGSSPILRPDGTPER